MNNLILPFFSLLGLSFFIGCKSKTSYPASVNGKSLLWEVSGNGLKKPSYFYGTMHLMCDKDAELTKTVKSIVKNVDQIYLEVDLDNASELLSGIFDLSSPNAKTLSNTLSADDYNKVKSFFEKYQPATPFALFEKQPPLMMLSVLYELMLPCEQKNGVELKLIDEAYKHKKETKGLETVAFQAAIINSIPYEEQAKDLVKSIDSLEKNRKAIEEMIAVYKSQDVEKLYDLSASEESSASSHMDELLYKRNHNWVSKFPKIVRDSSTLFAVGAGHLGGENGVLQLLKKQGYVVKPLAN